MLRILFSVALSLFSAGAVLAQSEAEVAEARLVYIAGDYTASLKILRPAAEAGNPNAQNIMGAAYEDGNGVAQDRDEAIRWYELSAAQDFDKAVYNLGVMHEKSDPALAITYYDRAIALNYSAAMHNRALMLLDGRGGSPDSAAAADLFQSAADLGYSDAMSSLGVLYSNGDGVYEDQAYALELFQTAAATGNLTALNNLGTMYDSGYGVTYDPLAAMVFYMVAAERGEVQAAINLAYTLIETEDGWRDPVAGYGWCLSGLARAGADLVDGYTEDCDYLSGLLDDDTRAAGEAMAATLYP